MEVLKFQLEAGMCHTFNKSLTIVVDGSSLNLKQKFDFVDGMKLKGHNSTPLNQP
jgi:hypothetical protein